MTTGQVPKKYGFAVAGIMDELRTNVTDGKNYVFQRIGHTDIWTYGQCKLPVHQFGLMFATLYINNTILQYIFHTFTPCCI